MAEQAGSIAGRIVDQETQQLRVLKEAEGVEESKKIHNSLRQVGRQQNTGVGRAAPAQLSRMPRNKIGRKDGPTVAVTVGEEEKKEATELASPTCRCRY